MRSALRPVIALSQLVGITPVQCKRNVYEKSPYKVALWVLLMLVYLSLSMYYGYIYGQNTRVVSLIKFMLMMEYFLGLLHVIITWICGIVYQNEYVDVLRRLIKVDEELQTLGETIDYEKFRRTVLIKLVAHVLMISALVGIQMFFVHKRDAGEEDISPIFIVLLHFPVFVSLCIVENVSTYTYVIKNRFGVLNRRLEALQKYDEKIDEAEEYKVKVLRVACPIHMEFTEISKSISAIFGHTLLMMYALNFISITMGCYLICVACKYLDQDVQLVVLPEAVLRMAGNIFYTYILCYCCHTTVDECTRSGLLLHSIDFEGDDLKEEIQMFSMQILHENLEFSAGGFFPVNYTLLFSIVGGLTTYIIILIQFSTNSGEDIKNYYSANVH